MMKQPPGVLPLEMQSRGAVWRKETHEKVARVFILKKYFFQ